MFGELDRRCASEITPKSALIDPALSFAGPSEQRAQLCANLGATTFNPDGSVAHHKADGRLVWAAAKELPESLFSVGAKPPSPARNYSGHGRWSRTTCSAKHGKRREGAPAPAQWHVPFRNRSSRTPAKAKSSAPMKNTRLSRACSRNDGSTTVRALSSKRTYGTPLERHPNSSRILSGGVASRQLGVDVTNANEALWKWTHLIDTAAGNVAGK